MNTVFWASKIPAAARAFACNFVLFCCTLEGIGAPELVAKGVAVDNCYVVVVNDKGAKQTTWDQTIYIAIRTTGSQDIPVWIPTGIESQYEIELFDSQNNSVTKTALGKKVGRKFSELNISLGRIGQRTFFKKTFAASINETGADYLVQFRPSDYFDIRRPGDYTLRLRLQIVEELDKTSSRMKVVRFPPLDLALKKE